MILLSLERNGKNITKCIYLSYFSISQLLPFKSLLFENFTLAYAVLIKSNFYSLSYIPSLSKKTISNFMCSLKRRKMTLWFYVELLIWVRDHVSEHGQSVSQGYHSWRNWTLSRLGDINDNTLQQGMGFMTTSHPFGILTALIFYGFYTHNNGCYKFKCAVESKHFCFALVIHCFWLLLSLLSYIFQDDPVSL